jgi:hypothetical protein
MHQHRSPGYGLLKSASRKLTSVAALIAVTQIADQRRGCMGADTAGSFA